MGITQNGAPRRITPTDLGTLIGGGGGGMVYPGAGIAVSTGAAWGTSIADNSGNWNTAYGWGNHASAGYITASSTNTLTNKTWNGNIIAVPYGGTGLSSYAVGDILYASGATTLVKLSATTDGHILTLASGVPSWAANTGGSAAGSTGQLQYNNAGVFAASANVTLTTTFNLGVQLLGTLGTFNNRVQAREFLNTGNSTIGFGYRSATGGAGWGSSTHHHFHANPTNYPTPGSGIMRGFYAQMTGTLAANATIGFENTGGDNFLNSASGSTVIGRSSASGAITSAKFAIDSTTGGFLPPRMTTTQRNAISSPAEGLIVYDLTIRKLFVYTSTWEQITSV